MSDAASRGFVRGTERDRGCERVAMFLLLIGATNAARVLPHLDEGEVIGIAGEIARITRIEPREAARVMDEFGYGRSAGAAGTRGGSGAARRLLRAAFPEKRAAELLRLAAATCGPTARENDGNGAVTRYLPAGERQRGATDDDD